MKKAITLILILALCAGLCGCGAKETPAPEQTAAPTIEPTDAPTAEPSAAPTEEPTAAPTDEPVPEETVAEKNSLYDTLVDLYANYHPGTAGSSLALLRFAGYIMDQYMDHGADFLTAGALAYDLGEADEYGDRIADKLESVYSSALMLYGENGQEMLGNAGYTPARWGYTGVDIKEAFGAIYLGLDMAMPDYLRVYRSDDQAERFLCFAMECEEPLDAETRSHELEEMIFAETGAALNSVREENGTVYADINTVCAQKLRSLGTSGEYMTLGALVNTLLEAFEAEEVVLTAEGAVLETGHAVYDQPLTYFEENIA